MDKPHVGNQIFYRIIFFFKFRDINAPDAIRTRIGTFRRFFRNELSKFPPDHFAKRWHIHAIDFRNRFQDFHAGKAFLFAFADRPQNFRKHFFAVADIERVKKIRYRFRIRHRRAAAKNNRIAFLAVLRKGSDSCKLQYIGNIRKVEFCLERHPDNIEFPHRRPRCMRVKRNIMSPHFPRHIVPRSKGYIHPQIRFAVYDMVQHAQTVVRKSDFIQVRKDERHPRKNFCRILDNAVRFATHIAGRAFYGRKNLS